MTELTTIQITFMLLPSYDGYDGNEFHFHHGASGIQVSPGTPSTVYCTASMSPPLKSIPLEIFLEQYLQFRFSLLLVQSSSGYRKKLSENQTSVLGTFPKA